MVESVPSTFAGMFIGYAALWGILSVYILCLGRRLSRLERNMENRPGR